MIRNRKNLLAEMIDIFIKETSINSEFEGRKCVIITNTEHILCASTVPVTCTQKPVLQIKKWGHREIKQLPCCPTACRQHSGCRTRRLAPESVALTATHLPRGAEPQVINLQCEAQLLIKAAGPLGLTK